MVGEEESKYAINPVERTPSDLKKPTLCVQCADLARVSNDIVHPKMVSISLHCVHSSLPADGSIDSRRGQEELNPCPKIQSNAVQKVLLFPLR